MSNLISKLTLNQAKNIFKNCGYELCDKNYINNYTKMTAIDKNGYKIYSNIRNIRINDKPRLFHKCNPHTLENIELYLKLNRHKYTQNRVPSLKENQKYENIKTPMIWICSNCNNEFISSFDHIKKFSSCPYCCTSPQKIKQGYNDIATTNPELIKYFLNKSDTKKYT